MYLTMGAKKILSNNNLKNKLMKWIDTELYVYTCVMVLFEIDSLNFWLSVFKITSNTSCYYVISHIMYL